MPAQCATALQPENAAVSCSTSSSPRLAVQTTSCPSPVRRFVKWPPTKPVAPVIAIFMILLLVDQVVTNFFLEEGNHRARHAHAAQQESSPKCEVRNDGNSLHGLFFREDVCNQRDDGKIDEQS